MLKSLLIIAASVCCCVQLAGCAVAAKDAPWDPRAGSGRTLIDQIPNWDRQAELTCGGHLTPQEARRQGRTQRC